MKTILVTGATGHQGRSVIEHLLKSKSSDPNSTEAVPTFSIIATTRNTSSVAARQLEDLGNGRVELAQCDLNNSSAIRSIFDARKATRKSIYGVFGVLAFPGLGKNADAEEAQGKVLVDIAVEYGVEHFVYSSVDRGGEGNDDNYTLDKAAKVSIERYLKTRTAEAATNVKWTILRPAFFMINFLGPIGKITAAVLRKGLEADTEVQLVDVGDIGRIARIVFENPGTYASTAFAIGSDSLTASGRDEAYSRAQEGTTSDNSGRKQALPSVPGLLARALIKWNGHTKALCADIERVYKDNLEAGNGNSGANLEMARSALSKRDPLEYGVLTSFEDFCAKHYEGGKGYAVANAEHQTDGKNDSRLDKSSKEKEKVKGVGFGKQNWNGVSIGRLLSGKM